MGGEGEYSVTRSCTTNNDGWMQVIIITTNQHANIGTNIQTTNKLTNIQISE